MSTVAGVFSETLINDILIKTSMMTNDDGSRVKQQYLPRYGVLQYLKDLQTASEFDMLSEPSKKQKIRLDWLNACQVEDRAVTACTFGGNDLSTNAQEYELTLSREVPFVVNAGDFDTNVFNYEEAVAKGFLRAEQQLLEWYSQQVVAILNANLGVNEYDDQFTVGALYTDIPAAYWTAELVPYFMLVEELNKFKNSTFLSGSQLFQAAKRAGYGADDNGKNAMFNDLNMKFDVFNIDTVNGQSKISYLISMGAVALATRARNVGIKQVAGDQTWFSMTSNYLPWVKYDVFLKTSCDNDFAKHEYRVKLMADMFVNPTGCSADNTGILGFRCA